MWILDNQEDDEGLYYGDENHTSQTIVAVSGRQVCILKIEIKGLVPPKFV